MARRRVLSLVVVGGLSALVAFALVVSMPRATVPEGRPELVVAPVRVPVPAPSPVPAVVEASEEVVPEEAEAVVPEEAFASVLRGHTRELRGCYEEALDVNAEAWGPVELELWVEGGRVVEVLLDGQSEAGEVFTDCVAEEAMGWDLSEVPDAQLSWPMRFQPPGGW
mgnify:CR=1 FL=1